MLALYKGLAAPLLGVSVINAIIFTANGIFRRMLTPAGISPNTPISLEKIFLAGAGAGFVNSFVVSPVELVKIQMQISFEGKGQTRQGPLQFARHLVQQRGLLSLYRGLWATILRETPGCGMWYTGFEFCKRISAERMNLPPNNLPVHVLIGCGAIAGICYWLPWIYPIDVVKSKIQAHPASLNHIPGFVNTALQLYRKEGWRPFYKGYSPTLIRALPGAGVAFATYEVVYRYLDKLRLQKFESGA